MEKNIFTSTLSQHHGKHFFYQQLRTKMMCVVASALLKRNDYILENITKNHGFLMRLIEASFTF